MRRSRDNKNSPDWSDDDETTPEFKSSDVDMIDGMLHNYISSNGTKTNLSKFYIQVHAILRFYFC